MVEFSKSRSFIEGVYKKFTDYIVELNEGSRILRNLIKSQFESMKLDERS